LIVAAIRDVTARKQTHDDPHGSEEQFRLLANSVEDYAILRWRGQQ